MYRRNRFYDPASGRFTQEDPIGLAGGLNSYGFAGGDPVTFGDPFGLKPCDENGSNWLSTAWANLQCSLTQSSITEKVRRSEGIPLRESPDWFKSLVMGITGAADVSEDEAFSTGWRFNRDEDLDWRGTGRNVGEAVDEAFKRTGASRSEFRVTRWGRDANGKSFPV